ncbi:MAG: AIM24 family protein [Opitutales bacterium]|nr:AIM24 family protein [Opitutales bacterium]
MVSKLKFFAAAFLLAWVGIALFNVDWQRKNQKILKAQTFEEFCAEDARLSRLEKRKERAYWFEKPELYCEIFNYKAFTLRPKYEALNLLGSARIYYQKSFLENLQASRTLRSALFAAFFLAAMPLFWRAFLYWCAAPCLGKSRPVKFFKSDSGEGENSIRILGGGEKSLPVKIAPKESLIVVSENFVSGYGDALSKKMRWLFSWSHPIMSVLCGLCAMNRYENPSGHAVEIDITSDNPDDYFIEIELKDCAGAFFVPSNIRAFSDGLKISCKWNLFSFASFCMKRFRYYSISGSGRIVLCAAGGFTQKDSAQKPNRRKPASLVFSSANLDVRAKRTELFYPYLTAQTDLFDIIIQGGGKFLVKNTSARGGFFERISSPDSLLNVIGRLFGF